MYQKLYNQGVSLVFLKEPHINTSTYQQAMENQLSSAETQSIDYSDYVQNLSAQQQSQLSQIESDGTAIADALTKLNLKNQIVKAQMLYLTY